MQVHLGGLYNTNKDGSSGEAEADIPAFWKAIAAVDRREFPHWTRPAPAPAPAPAVAVLC